MTDTHSNPQELAKEFKRKGFFDTLKREILTREVPGLEGNNTLVFQEHVESIVQRLVQDMIEKDSTLLFKESKASSVSLVESQFTKNNNEHLNGILQTLLVDNAELKARLNTQLAELLASLDK